jgi:hypothetical protein
MMAGHFPRLVFKYPFDEAAAYDAEARGYLSYASVELSEGTRYPVVFYDPVRLQQDLEVEVGEGRPFIAEPGLIIVPEVTLARMQAAVEGLCRTGFFDALRREREQGRGSGEETGGGVVPEGRPGNGAVATPTTPAPLPLSSSSS